MVQREHTPRLRTRLYSILSAFSVSASLAWTMVQISLGTGRSDAPPRFICVWGGGGEMCVWAGDDVCAGWIMCVEGVCVWGGM